MAASAIVSQALASPATVLYLRQGSFIFGTTAIMMIFLAVMARSTTNFGVFGDNVGTAGIASFAGAVVLSTAANFLDDPAVSNLSRKVRIVTLAVAGVGIAILLAASTLKNLGWIQQKTKSRMQFVAGLAIVSVPFYIYYRSMNNAPRHFISKTWEGICYGTKFLASKIFRTPA